MTTKEIAYKAALELDLPPKYVWEVYKSYWMFIRHYITSLNIKEIDNEKDFNKIRTSVNVPSLGKFYLDWDRIENKRKGR
jgi:hypothetical protein